MGDNALALVRALGNRDLGAAGRSPAPSDATYFPVLDRLVRYPGSLVWPLGRARRSWPSPSWRSSCAGGGSARCAGRRAPPRSPCCRSSLAPLAAQGLWSLLVADPPGLRGDARSVAARLVPAGHRRRRRSRSCCSGTRCCAAGSAPRRSPPGALVWLAVLGAVLAAVAPGGSYLVGVAGAGRRRHRHRRRGHRQPAWCAWARRWSAARSPSWCSRPPSPCSSPRSACAPPRSAASSRRCSSSPCCPPSSCCSPTRTAGAGGSSSAARARRRRRPRRGLRRRGAVGRPVRRRPPGAQPARVRAGPRHRPGVVGQHGELSGRLHGAVRRAAAARCRSTSRTWPARRWRLGDAQPADLPAPQVDGRCPTTSSAASGRSPCGSPRSGPASGCWRSTLGVDGGTVVRAQAGRPRRPRGGARRATRCGSPSTRRRPTGCRPRSPSTATGRSTCGSPTAATACPACPATSRGRTASTRPARTAPTWCWSRATTHLG